jgi:hypothetical protein
MIVRELLALLKLKVDGSGFKQAEAAFKGLGAAVVKISGFALAAKGALLAVVQSTADHAREIENTARVTGLTTAQVQELGYAAKASGVSSEELQHGLIHLARSAQEAALGSGEAAAGYYRLGISTTGADGKVRPLGDLLSQLAQKFQQMPDGTAKAAAAVQIFGRAGAELIPFLDQGPAGIAALSAEADKLGIVMGGKTLASATRYRDAMRRMMGAVEGLKIAIADRLFPAFTKSAQQLGQWILLHRQWLALKVEQAFNAVTQVLRGLATGAVEIVKAFDSLWKMGTAAKVTLVALGAAAALAFAPFTLAATAIALVAEDLSAYFSDHSDKWKEQNTMIGLIVAKFKDLGEELSTQWSLFEEDPFETLRKWATDFFDWFVEMASNLPERVKEAIGNKGKGPATIGDWLMAGNIDAQGPGGDEARAAMDAKFAPKTPAFRGVPGSTTGYEWVDGKPYAVDAPPPAGRGGGPAA